LSLRGHYGPDNMCTARKYHSTTRGLHGLCKDTRKSVSNIILAGAQLLSHRYHHGSARRCCYPHGFRWWWRRSNSSSGLRSRRCWSGCHRRCRRRTWSRSRTRRVSRCRSRSRRPIRIRTLCRRGRSRSRR
jgi:hypothetical protein